MRVDLLRSVLIAGCLLTLATFGGCGVSPQSSSSSKAVSSQPIFDSMDPFWRGLERHEIQLGQILLVVKGSRGVVACPYLNIESFAKTGEACAIVPARNTDGMPDSQVTAVTPAAEALGITVGMSGREALERIR